MVSNWIVLLEGLFNTKFSVSEQWRTLSGLTYNELDQLETLHMEALKRISAAKVYAIRVNLYLLLSKRQQMESERKQMQVTYDAQLAEIQQVCYNYSVLLIGTRNYWNIRHMLQNLWYFKHNLLRSLV